MKLLHLSLVSLLLSSSIVYAETMDDVSELQHRWAKANYLLDDKAQIQAFEDLITTADTFIEQTPDKAEIWIWRGIIKSSFAGVKGGLGALSYAKQAKSDFEKAMTIDDQALAGSAYTSLGTLYYKVPGWPISFGDDDKAESLLKKAITINPTGIDSNYFYGDYWLDQGEYQQAYSYLKKANDAPARPERPLADQERHKEIDLALDLVEKKLNR